MEQKDDSLNQSRAKGIEINNIEIDDIPNKADKEEISIESKEITVHENDSNELTVPEKTHELMSDFKDYIRKNKNGLTTRKKVVRRVTAIFLIILALLTFFSNTIMNYSLPEVSTVTIASGKVSEKVRCQGTAEVSKDITLTVSGERVVKEVFYEDGDFVNEGDVIMSFEDSENVELSEAEKTLEDLEYSYKKSQLREKTDYTDDEEEIQNARDDLSEAQAALEQARTDEISLADARIAQSEAQSAYDEKNKEVSGLQAKVDEYDKLEKKDSEVDVDKLISELATAKEELTALETKLNAANELVTSLSEKTTVAAAESNVTDKEQSLNSLVRKYNNKKESDNLTAQANELDDEKSLNEIEEQKEKIEKLKSGSDFKEIKASASGVISGITSKKGDKLEANASVAYIQLINSGYEVSCNISKKDSELIRKGAEATVENVWDENVKAEVKSIKADPSDPNQKSVVKFTVKGNVMAGETLQFSVGDKSDRYDTVVPNSAVKEDSDGYFLLVVKSKATPLGNRYMVKHVAVDVQASDDSHSAVVGDISEYDNVVTNSSKPLDDKQQVRLSKN